jgi:hypothetical protein
VNTGLFFLKNKGRLSAIASVEKKRGSFTCASFSFSEISEKRV